MGIGPGQLQRGSQAAATGAENEGGELSAWYIHG
jgi:hypothetical protein